MQIKAGGFYLVTAAQAEQYASVMSCVPGVQCSGTLFANVCHARYRELSVRFVEVGSVDSVIRADECDSDTEYDTDDDADYECNDDGDERDNDSTNYADSSYQYQPDSTYDTQQYGQLYNTGINQQQYADSDNVDDSDNDEQENDETEYYSDSDSSEECAIWIDEHSIHCVFERLHMAWL
jgi:hypothetical protein